MKNKLLSIGSINMDLVLKMERMPVSGESLIGEDYFYVPGGKGANQAVAACRLGADTSFAGCLGDDSHGEILIHKLQDEGIDTKNVRILNGVASGLAVIMLEGDGQNRIAVYPGANGRFNDEYIDDIFADDYDIALIQFEIPVEIVVKCCAAARQRDIKMVVDAGPSMDFPLEKLEGLFLLSPNESEAKALTGIDVIDEKSAEIAAEILYKRCRPHNIVIKMGAKGAYAWTEGSGHMVDGYKINAVDTTAAGDSATAAMAVSLSGGADIFTAVKYANAAGALAATVMGAQPSMPTADIVENFINNRN